MIRQGNYRSVDKNSLGCGLEVLNDSNRNDILFVCGLANAWGKEKLCQGCEQDLKAKWKNQDNKFYAERIKKFPNERNLWINNIAREDLLK